MPMSDTTQLREEAPATILSAAPTPLVEALGIFDRLVEARGARTPSVFSDAERELAALATDVAVFDQGARVRLRITGEDRVRWLNGMVTNTIKALAPGTHNYTFVLNAQGRIQGDATVFAFADHLVLETDRSQAERLFAHFDRFIIMDDVELAWAPSHPQAQAETTLGLAGPGSAALLAAVNLPIPAPETFAASQDATVVAEYSPLVPRFSIWIPINVATSFWQQILTAGATPAGAFAVDALRVLEGTPLYGVDITEKTLAQETGQMRALNFNKGCYLGQEIVERVRSRANVHRGIRQIALHGDPASAGMPLTAEGAPIGELTSITAICLPGAHRQIALATIRTEAIGRTIEYPGGTAELLTATALPALNESPT